MAIHISKTSVYEKKKEHQFNYCMVEIKSKLFTKSRMFPNLFKYFCLVNFILLFWFLQSKALIFLALSKLTMICFCSFLL